MSVNAQAGLTASLVFQFFSDDTGSGVLTDPASVQLDLTYGSAAPAPGDSSQDIDAGGPFTYQGASTVTPGQVWRVSTGVYRFDWAVPLSINSGAYVANWAAAFGSDLIGATENVNVVGAYGVGQPVPQPGDTGPWRDSITGPDGTVVQFGQIDADPGTAGVVWRRVAITGTDGPDTSGSVVQRSGDHGGYATPQYYAARQLTVTCTAQANTQALRDAARAKLQRAVAIGGGDGDLSLLVLDQPVPKQLLVRRNGKIIESYPNAGEADFNIGLTAPDPRMYSTVLRSASVQAAVTLNGITPPLTPPIAMPANGLPAVIAALNAGTFETRPVVRVNGPIQNPSLTLVDTGQAVSFTGLTLATGQQLIVDFDQRQATLGGTSLVPADIASAWWVLEPGTSTIRLGGIASSGSGMTAQWRDAYI